jgi:hypothetical protein
MAEMSQFTQPDASQAWLFVMVTGTVQAAADSG